MNFMQVAGHLGADPEVRFTATGKKVTVLRVAAKSRKGGQDHTIWWRVTIWGEQYDQMIAHLRKGSAIIVFGTLEPPEIYNNRDNVPQISLNITASHLQFSPFGKTERDMREPSSKPVEQPSYEMAGGSPAKPEPSFDDEVPF